ncbi:YceI family protein [Polaribacter sp. R77954]|uniref:YceI family protein n=1 Tax=Polaribacter sp. R77954 TaxID=3093870 RepID=UPI0037C6DCA2
MKKLGIAISLLFTMQLLHAQEKLNIDTNKSTIKWIGELTFNFGGHDGYINFKEGFFIKENKVITGGEFIIDMNSITNTDIKEKALKVNLVDHLKNEDFFDVKNHPTAKLKIKNVEYFNDEIYDGRIFADLTIKDITKPIQFFVNFNYKKQELQARFKIDRKEWGINYQSKFKNSFISDAIGFDTFIKLQ